METIKFEFKAPLEAIDIYAKKRAGYQATIKDENGAEVDNPVSAKEHSEKFVPMQLLKEMEKALVQDAIEKAKAQASVIKQAIINAQ